MRRIKFASRKVRHSFYMKVNWIMIMFWVLCTHSHRIIKNNANPEDPMMMTIHVTRHSETGVAVLIPTQVSAVTRFILYQVGNLLINSIICNTLHRQSRVMLGWVLVSSLKTVEKNCRPEKSILITHLIPTVFSSKISTWTIGKHIIMKLFLPVFVSTSIGLTDIIR